MTTEEIKQELDAMKAEKYHLLKLINHDIRSPFNRIFALMQLLEMESPELTQQQQEYYDAIYLTVLSGLEMVQNLRDLRDIDGGMVKIEKTPTHLDEIIHKAVRTYSRQTELKKMTVEITCDSEVGELSTDPYFLQRCIENMLSNSIKFSPSKKTISITAGNRGDMVRIEVQDHGPGIRLDEEVYLFEKFKKLSSLATGGEGSLGLGLYNTWHFARLLGAVIRLDRNGKLGSCFILSMPCS